MIIGMQKFHFRCWDTMGKLVEGLEVLVSLTSCKFFMCVLKDAAEKKYTADHLALIGQEKDSIWNVTHPFAD